MSGKLVSVILQKDIPEGKLLAVALASHCFQNSLSCFPGLELLARECQVKERQIKRYLKKLKSSGLLTAQRRGQQSAIYTFHPEKVPDLRGDTYDTSESTRGDIHDASEVTSGAPQGDIQVPPNKEEPVLTGKSNRKSKAESSAELFPTYDALPDWLPRAEWKGYVEMRKKIRSPMTDFAQDLIIRDIDELRKQGHDPKLMLRQSIKNDWKDVYPPKESNGGNRGYLNRAEKKQASTVANAQQARSRIVARG